MRRAERALAAINAGGLRVPGIEACHMIVGAFDYLLKVRTGDIGTDRWVLAERISDLPHLAGTSTHVAMQMVKEDGPPV